MRRFLVRLFLFCLPLIALFGFPALVLLASGELLPLDVYVYAAQHLPQSRFGLAYSNPIEAYKLRLLLVRQPRVVALGTSRVMQFRQQLFQPPESFYNAGGIIARVEHLNPVLARIPRAQQPDVLIVGLDQYFFNPRWTDMAQINWDAQLDGTRNPDAFKIFTANWRQVYADAFAGKFSLLDVLPNATTWSYFGLNARVRNRAFRFDGSHAPGNGSDPLLDRSAEDYEYRDTLRRIEAGSDRFKYAQALSADALQALDRFLSAARARGIHVVGFLPPYAHTIYAKMMAMGDDYAYMKKLPLTLQPMFEQYGFTFYDFSDIASVGASDAETLDGFHGTETAYLRLFLQMIDRDPILKRYAADQDWLRAELRQAAPQELFAP